LFIEHFPHTESRYDSAATFQPHADLGASAQSGCPYNPEVHANLGACATKWSPLTLRS